MPEETVRVGGFAEKVAVTLAIYSASLDPNAVSAILDCTPTRAHRKGDVFGRKNYVRQTGAWLLSCEGAPPVDGLIDTLLEKLPSDAAVWERLASEYDVQLRFGVFMDGDNREFDLSPETVQRIAHLHAALVFDIYAH